MRPGGGSRVTARHRSGHAGWAVGTVARHGYAGFRSRFETPHVAALTLIPDGRRRFRVRRDDVIGRSFLAVSAVAGLQHNRRTRESNFQPRREAPFFPVPNRNC